MSDATGDKTVTCVDCGAQFTFTARDQQFYQERGYQAPRRCKTCRDKRKSSGSGNFASGAPSGNRAQTPPGGMATRGSGDAAGQGPAHSQFKVQCSGCGTETTVPFKPDPNRPVYCRTCYLNRRKTGNG
ncbi:MAG TPA: zinc-ribbon domain containing protein [Planctomycetota bacterium]|jgi:CxxC-x17-CxxC domain-containing protein